MRTLFSMPIFGEIDLNSHIDCYEGEIALDGIPIPADLNFDFGLRQVSAVELGQMKKFIEEIPKGQEISHAAILKNFESGGIVKRYIVNHLDVLGNFEIAPQQKISKERQLLHYLRLKRIGLYPQLPDHFAVFDYSIGRQLTDYLIVAKFNEQGNIIALIIES